MTQERTAEFERFVESYRPRLLRALIGCRGLDAAPDAVGEALAYAWEHWEEVRGMHNPVGYLYRVGQSRSRRRKAPALPAPAAIGLPDIEPGLVPALRGLPETQRTAVWLVHACAWSYEQVAEAMGTTTSMVGNHVSRGMVRLRERLVVSADV